MIVVMEQRDDVKRLENNPSKPGAAFVTPSVIFSFSHLYTAVDVGWCETRVERDRMRVQNASLEAVADLTTQFVRDWETRERLSFAWVNDPDVLLCPKEVEHEQCVNNTNRMWFYESAYSTMSLNPYWDCWQSLRWVTTPRERAASQQELERLIDSKVYTFPTGVTQYGKRGPSITCWTRQQWLAFVVWTNTMTVIVMASSLRYPLLDTWTRAVLSEMQGIWTREGPFYCFDPCEINGGCE